MGAFSMEETMADTHDIEKKTVRSQWAKREIAFLIEEFSSTP